MEHSASKTIGVLNKIAEALKCKICNQTTSRPYNTGGGCSHFFCQNCLTNLDESKCPTCSQPFYPGDLAPDTIVGTILQEWNTITNVFKCYPSKARISELVSTTTKTKNNSKPLVQVEVDVHKENEPSLSRLVEKRKSSTFKGTYSKISNNTKSSVKENLDGIVESLEGTQLKQKKTPDIDEIISDPTYHATSSDDENVELPINEDKENYKPNQKVKLNEPLVRTNSQEPNSDAATGSSRQNISESSSKRSNRLKRSLIPSDGEEKTEHFFKTDKGNGKKKQRIESEVLLDEILDDIEHGESASVSKYNSNMNGEKPKKFGSIYTKQKDRSNSFPKIDSREVRKDINENSSVVENNETASLDMICNSQSPVKNCILKLNKIDVSKRTGMSSKDTNIKSTDKKNATNFSSDSENDFEGFQQKTVKIYSLFPPEKGLEVENKKSIRKRRKPSTNDDGDLNKNDESLNKQKKIKQIETTHKFDLKNSTNDLSTSLIQKRRTYKKSETEKSNVLKTNESDQTVRVGRRNKKAVTEILQSEENSPDIIPATPQDSSLGKVIDSHGQFYKKQKTEGCKGPNTSMNVNVSKRRDSVKLNKKGETPLQVACAKGNVVEVERLISEGADPNTRDFAGWTPLHEAVLKGNIRIVELLVSAGANINTPGHLNITPLLEAVLQENYVIVSFLLRNGADKSMRSRYNYRPLDCAVTDEMIKLLNQVDPLDGKLTKEASSNFRMPEAFCLCPISLNAEQSKLLRDFCIKFDLKCVESLRSEVTHAVVSTQENNVCKYDVNILKCLSKGTAVISFSWIELTLNTDELAKPDAWEVHGTTDFPNSEAFLKSRINAQKLLPKLFDGLHISFANYWSMWSDLKKCDIIDIARDAGAVILTREPDPEAIPKDEMTVMFHANADGSMSLCSHITLYVPGVKEPQLKYNMKHFKTLSLKWLIDCIQTFSILDPL